MPKKEKTVGWDRPIGYYLPPQGTEVVIIEDDDWVGTLFWIDEHNKLQSHDIDTFPHRVSQLKRKYKILKWLCTDELGYPPPEQYPKIALKVFKER